MPKKHSLSESMNRIGTLVHSTLDFEQVISEVAQAVGSETAVLLLRQGDHWVVRYAHGFPQDVIGTQMDDRQEPHPVLAIEARQPVVINDAFRDERVNCEHMKKWGVRSALVVPLLAADQVVGVLFFNQHQAGVPFQDSHVDFANQLATSVALALRNARLFENLQAELAGRKKAKQALQEANERLQAQTEELRVQGEELQSQAEELAAQAEELRVQTEELADANVTLEKKVALRTAELEYRAQQLQKLTLELSQAEDRERKRLAEILHDDLQQQLAATKFHLGLLANRVKKDAALHAMAMELDQMLKTAIERSRSLSHELSPAVLYASSLGETFVWLASQIKTKLGLTVHVDSRGQVDLQSDAMKAFLYKAGQELLFNVVKHARVQEARIRVRRSRRYVCLSVSDRGRGFDSQALRETAGFGLFSIRERVGLLGGRMKIQSATGQGSTFRIVVPDGPAVESSAGTKRRTDPVRASSPAALRGGRCLRVLLADDHAIVRQGLAELLREEGDIEVVAEAANGREAIDLAWQLRPAVVVMDVAMPMIAGDEATHQIKTHLPGTRVIAFSMQTEAEVEEKMRQAGVESYVLKTAPPEEIVAAIRGGESGS